MKKNNTANPSEITILAFVGMPGSGKSAATEYLAKKGIARIRFGDITEEGLKAQKLLITPENEQAYREAIRQELGMAAYAIKARPKIEELVKHGKVLVIDGLYSWEEYTYLKAEYQSLLLIHVFADAHIRYQRLAKRAVRPLTSEEARKRDIAEIENIHKSGPIAIADYLIENNTTLIELNRSIEKLLARLSILV